MSEPTNGQPANPNGAKRPARGGAIGVLIVEDEPLVLMDTASVFSAAGIAVFEAHDADAALAILSQRTDIQVLITDLSMPSGSLDGHALIQAVLTRWPRIGVLVLSGAERPKPGNLPAGIQFLSKPCRPQELVSATFAVVSRHTGSI